MIPYYAGLLFFSTSSQPCSFKDHLPAPFSTLVTLATPFKTTHALLYVNLLSIHTQLSWHTRPYQTLIGHPHTPTHLPVKAEVKTTILQRGKRSQSWQQTTEGSASPLPRPNRSWEETLATNDKITIYRDGWRRRIAFPAGGSRPPSCDDRTGYDPRGAER